MDWQLYIDISANFFALLMAFFFCYFISIFSVLNPIFFLGCLGGFLVAFKFGKILLQFPSVLMSSDEKILREFVSGSSFFKRMGVSVVAIFFFPVFLFYYIILRQETWFAEAEQNLSQLFLAIGFIGLLAGISPIRKKIGRLFQRS